YVCFGHGAVPSRTYPIELYERFLTYVRDRYNGANWHALPREIAARSRPQNAPPRGDWSRNGSQKTRTSCPSPSTRNRLAGKRAAVVLYSYYAWDPRPRRAAEALLHQGMEVDVLCLRRSHTLPTQEQLNGVNVFRIPLKRRRHGKTTYAIQYSAFFIASFILLTLRSLR